MAIATSIALSIASIAVAVAGAATSISLGVVSSVQQKKAARAQLQAKAEQAKVSSNQRIKQIRRIASQQKASFLSSGISLTGDGTPDAVISETFQTGIEDVENIRRYGATQGESISANARAQMLSTYGQIASDVSSIAGSALKGAGSLNGGSGAGLGGSGFFSDETSLAGMGDSFGSGSDFNLQAPSGFGSNLYTV